MLRLCADCMAFLSRGLLRFFGEGKLMRLSHGWTSQHGNGSPSPGQTVLFQIHCMSDFMTINSLVNLWLPVNITDLLLAGEQVVCIALGVEVGIPCKGLMRRLRPRRVPFESVG